MFRHNIVQSMKTLSSNTSLRHIRPRTFCRRGSFSMEPRRCTPSCTGPSPYLYQGNRKRVLQSPTSIAEYPHNRTAWDNSCPQYNSLSHTNCQLSPSPDLCHGQDSYQRCRPWRSRRKKYRTTGRCWQCYTRTAYDGQQQAGRIC